MIWSQKFIEELDNRGGVLGGFIQNQMMDILKGFRDYTINEIGG